MGDIDIDIDWSCDGRQAGYIHLPSSTNDSAWQDVRVPIYLLRGGNRRGKNTELDHHLTSPASSERSQFAMEILAQFSAELTIRYLSFSQFEDSSRPPDDQEKVASYCPA